MRPAEQPNSALPTLIQALLRLYRLLSAERRRHFWLAMLLMLVGAVAELVTIGAVLPFLALLTDPAAAQKVPAIRSAFELLGWGGDQSLVLPAALILAGSAIVAAVLRVMLTWVTQSFVSHFGHEIGTAIYSGILRQPYIYHVAHNSSQAIAAIEKVQSTLFSVLLAVMQGIISAFIAILIVAFLFFIDPIAAGASVIATCLIYIVMSLTTQTWLRQASATVADAHTARIKHIQEGLGGIRDIILDKSQVVFERGYASLDKEFRRAQMLSTFLAAAPRFPAEAAGILLVIAFAIHLSETEGGLIAAMPVLGAMALGAQRLLPLLQMLYSAASRTMASLKSIDEITSLASVPVRPAALYPNDPVTLARGVTLENVDYRYPASDQPALKAINLQIRSGERIGIIGGTGSGKSTLLDLVMGLLEPSTGKIFVDGNPLRTGELDAWQATIAHVPQFVFLTDGSVTNNIAFGVPPECVDIGRVREAAAKAQIGAFVESLPEGYATRVGERGIRLSGGQRQRIGIARALYKDASLLILDEATSALDSDTEARVMRGILESRPGVTVLMVAHRLTTLSTCDRLIRIEGGEIVDEGTYAEVLKSAGAS